jgi:hypothetical protein
MGIDVGGKVLGASKFPGQRSNADDNYSVMGGMKCYWKIFESAPVIESAK